MKTFKEIVLPFCFYIAAFIVLYGLGYVRGKDKGYDNGYIDGLRYATRLALEIATPKQTTNYIIVPIHTNSTAQ